MKIKLLLLFCFGLINQILFSQNITLDNRATGIGNTAILPDGWEYVNPISSNVVLKSGFYHLERSGDTADYLFSDIYNVQNYESLSVNFYYGNFGSGNDTKVRVELSLDGGQSYIYRLVTSQTANSTNLTGRSETLVFNSTIFVGLILTDNVRLRFSDDDGPKDVRLGKIVISGTPPQCTPPILNGNLTSTTYCGNSVLSFDNSISYTSSQLFWQATATGTSLGTPYTGDRTVTTSGTYYLRRFDGTCWSSAISVNVTVNQNPSMAGSLSVTNISCNISQITYSASSESGLYWQTIVSGTSTTNPYSSLTVTNTGTYYLRRLANGCWSDAKQITISGFNVNTIATQPQNVNTTVGSTANFTVSSLYTTGVTYQWQILNGSTWENISGGNTNNYNFTNAQLSDSGKQFRVLVTDACGTLISDLATLFVTVGPCYTADFNNITSGSSTTTGGSNTQLSTYSGFNTLTTLYNAGGAIRFGSGNNIGSITSNPLTNVSGNITVEISAKGWSQNERTIFISVNNIEQEFLIPTWIGGAFSSATFDFTNVALNSELKIYTKNGSNRAFVDDIKIFCNVNIEVCNPLHITSIFPINGPASTIVTLNTTEDFTNYNVFFGSMQAHIIERTSTTIKFIVPQNVYGITPVLKNEGNCEFPFNFYVTKFLGTECNLNSSNVYISEIYDANSGSLGFVELYNPSSQPIDLSLAKLRRYGDYNNLNSFSERQLSGTIAPNSVVIFKVDTSSDVACEPLTIINTTLSGINDNDLIELYFNDILIDVVRTPNFIGYSLIRNSNAQTPSIIYNDNDWTILETESCANLGSHNQLLQGENIQHTISYSTSCNLDSAVITTTATYLPSSNFTYQWYVNIPNTSSWTILTNNSDFNGVTTNVLTVFNLPAKQDYQYSCLIYLDGILCANISDAIKISGSSATVWNGNSWSNGTPAINTSAIINGNYNTQTNGSFSCCSLTVNENSQLIINANNYVEVDNNIITNGYLKVENFGQLVQINNDAVNTGLIDFEVKTQFKKWDYTHFTTPVHTYNVYTLSPNTLRNRIYEWNPTITSQYGVYGNWSNPQGNMIPGKGYLVTAPHNFSNSQPETFIGKFTGIPNNGIFRIPISRGNYNGNDFLNSLNNTYITKWDDNFNLIGNPYPSAISADLFLIENQDKLAGPLSFWLNTYGLSTQHLNPFFGIYDQNYNSNSFLNYNLTGSSAGPNTFNGYIAPSQGFFVTMVDGNSNATDHVVINNQMRSKDYSNQFVYRSQHPESRIWLDLVSSNQKLEKRILIGYVAGATNQAERLYDGVEAKSLSNDIYSMPTNSNESLVIQGRQLPFSVSDIVSLGLNFQTPGNYTISLAYLEGQIEEVEIPIYLEDRLLNFVHNLKEAPYNFSSVSGRFEDRFILKYQNTTLSTPNINSQHQVIVHGTHQVTIQTSNQNIVKVDVYNVLGQKLDTYTTNSETVTLSRLQKNNTNLIFYIQLDNGQKVTKQYIY